MPEVDAQSAAGVSALSTVQAHTPCPDAGFVVWMSKLSCVLISSQFLLNLEPDEVMYNCKPRE